jgi:pyridoxine/pyridoxamine 5'-phosphate oxidase
MLLARRKSIFNKLAEITKKPVRLFLFFWLEFSSVGQVYTLGHLWRIAALVSDKYWDAKQCNLRLSQI